MSVGVLDSDRAATGAAGSPPSARTPRGLLRLRRGHENHDDERGERRAERGLPRLGCLESVASSSACLCEPDTGASCETVVCVE